MKEFSATARLLYDTFAGRHVWITYADLRDVIGNEHLVISRSWNELKAAKLTQGEILRGEEARILKKDAG